MSCYSIELVVQTVRSGVGASYLPSYVARSEPALVRIGPLRRTGMSDLWLLYSTQRRDAPKVKAVADMVSAAVDKLRPMIEGREN